jgi:hypothetical protein
MCGAAATTVRFLSITLSHREISDGFGLKGSFLQSTFIPAASNALAALVRDAKSRSEFRRSHSEPST